MEMCPDAAAFRRTVCLLYKFSNRRNAQINEKTKLLVYLGAAIATDCAPCFEHFLTREKGTFYFSWGILGTQYPFTVAVGASRSYCRSVTVL